MAANRQTFDNFRTTPENREAVEACRAVSESRFTSAAPLVLFGAPGGGKSHLVWAILNEVRAGAARVGIALVLSRDFPERVRRLTDDPSPLQRGQPVILLVDELELFRDDAPALEAVVRLFHELGHCVVLSSNVHPDRLHTFSEAFRALLKEGTLFEVMAAGQHRNVDVVALQEQLAQLEAEKAALLPEQERADRLQTQLEALEARAQAAEAAREESRERVTVLEAAVEALEQERGVLQKQVGSQAPLQQELASLRKLLSEAVADAEAAMAQQARLQGQLSGAREQLERQGEDHAALQTEHEQMIAATRQIHELVSTRRRDTLRQLETLRLTLEEVFGDLARLGAMEEERNRLRRELEEAWTQLAALEAAVQAGADAGMTVPQAQAEIQRLENLLEEARGERGKLKITLDSAIGRVRGLQGELEKAQKQLSLQAKEMDGLRQEAAGQVAGATIRLGEIQNELLRYREAWEAVESLKREARGDMREVQRLIAAGAQAAERLAGRMQHMLQLQPQQEPEGAEDAEPTPEPDLFEAIPDTSEAPEREEE